jgi:transglycosylase-like protein
MHAKTALAVAGSVLAVPSAALAAAPDDDALHPSGKLTHDPRLKHRLVREHVRLAPSSNVRRLRTLPVSVLRERNHRLRKRAARNAPAASPALEAIAACESGGNPSAIGGGGAYRGKYQFDYGTWASVGGSGDPAAAPEAEQDKRAAMLYSRTGASSWPVCGR